MRLDTVRIATARQRSREKNRMRKVPQLCMIAVVWFTGSTAMAADRPPWPSTLPVYDHIVIVVEENKDFEQILGDRFDAPYIRK